LNKRYEIACLPGDGIGIEVMDATKIVLDKLKFDANLEHGDIGWKIWCNEGDPFPQRTIDLCKRTDCALFAAITSKPKDEAARELKPELHGKGFVYSSPIVGMRQLFDLHTNMRPCKAYQGNPLNVKEDIDLVIFRENTEGLYAGVEYYPLEDELRSTMTKFNKKMAKFDSVSPEDIAITARIITRRGCERIIRSAFEFAKKDGRKTVTVVEKPNVLRETSGLFLRIAREIAKEYPDIETRETNIDAQCMFLVRQPEDFGVMVTSNLFGDILSDLSAQLIGGLGFAPSANFGDNYAVFEPTHGSAPPLAGKGIANPTAMILTAQMMLDHLGEKEMALKLERAVADVLAEGKVQCQDMGGTASTMDMAKAIAAKL
jgi:3-isopropylmalate dehydrogenase